MCCVSRFVRVSSSRDILSCTCLKRFVKTLDVLCAAMACPIELHTMEMRMSSRRIIVVEIPFGL